MLAFSQIKWVLLYFPKDKESGYEPFTTYPIKETNFSQDIFSRILSTPEERITLLVNYEAVHCLCTACKGRRAFEANPRLLHSNKKNVSVSIQQLVAKIPRFASERRVILPVANNFLGNDGQTADFSDADNGVNSSNFFGQPDDLFERQTHGSSDQRNPSNATEIQQRLPLLSLPVNRQEQSLKTGASASTIQAQASPGNSVTISNASTSQNLYLSNLTPIRPASASTIKDASQSPMPTSATFAVCSTVNPLQALHASSKTLPGIPSTSSIDARVISAGFQPFTAEANYFLLNLILRRLASLEAQVQLLQGQCNEHKTDDDFILSPASSVEEAESLILKASDEGFHKKLVHALTLLGGGTLKKAVIKIVSAMMTNDVQVCYNRTGSDNKMPFAPFEPIVRMAIRRNYSNATDEEIKLAIVSTLKNSVDRNGGRKRRMLALPENQPEESRPAKQVKRNKSKSTSSKSQKDVAIVDSSDPDEYDN